MANHRRPTNGSVGVSGHNFDAFVSSQRSYHHDTDWAAKLQEKYWRAKQKFLAKVERNEDSCVVLSDSKLDAKLEVYRSIDKSCARLTNILENYQNNLFVFANEENALGIMLKECGKNDRTKAGKIMSITGKSLTQSSHQRIRLYIPLLRLFQEMETFHSRAVDDTSSTVSKLESKRSQYRASLLWMKDISEKLDPDVYRQLDKFRRVQAKVRDDKKTFDAIQMDVVQKIDLLMASRCNLMNQILAPYQSILLETFERNFNNFSSIEEIIKKEDIYDYEFKTLKQLNPLRLGSKDEEDAGKCDGEAKEETNDQVQPNKEIDLLIDDELEPSGIKNDPKDKKRSNLELISEEFGKSYFDGQGDQLNDVCQATTSKSEPDEGIDTLDLLEDLFGKSKTKKSSPGAADTKSDRDQAVLESGDAKDIKRQQELEAARANLMNLNLFDICDEKQVESLLSLSENPACGGLLSGDDLYLLGDADAEAETKKASNAQKEKKQPTIDDLLLNELEDIDNSSYLKSLQGVSV